MTSPTPILPPLMTRPKFRAAAEPIACGLGGALTLTLPPKEWRTGKMGWAAAADDLFLTVDGIPVRVRVQVTVTCVRSDRWKG